MVILPFFFQSQDGAQIGADSRIEDDIERGAPVNPVPSPEGEQLEADRNLEGDSCRASVEEVLEVDRRASRNSPYPARPCSRLESIERRWRR